ncbi:MAG: hypothetical protein ACYCW6_31870 [Candidatus Xenobia bacterium]
MRVSANHWSRCWNLDNQAKAEEATAAALAAVEEQPLVREVSLAGSRIHAVVTDAAAAAELEQRLHVAHFPLHRARIITPSLEDVFVSLMEPVVRGIITRHPVSLASGRTALHS